MGNSVENRQNKLFAINISGLIVCRSTVYLMLRGLLKIQMDK